jgi:EpsI family protein
MSTSTVAQTPVDEPNLGKYPLWPPIVFILIVGSLIVFSKMVGVGAAYTPSESGIVMNLPVVVSNYLGIKEDVSEAEKVILPTDTQFAKRTYSGDGDSINAQIVLSGAEKRSIHRPEYCLPGQGWRIKSTEVIPIPIKDGSVLKVTKLVISKPIYVGSETRELTSCYLYWFVGKDFSTPSHLQRQLRTTWDLVFHKINHRWAYVIVSAPVLEGLRENGKNETQTMDMLEKFISDLAPKIMKSLGAKEPDAQK